MMTKTAYQHMMDQEPYDVNDPKLVEDRVIARRLYTKLNHTNFEDEATKTSLVKQLFGSTGDSVVVRPSFKCDYGYNIHVGEQFFANFDCILLDTCEITIGKNCLLAPHVKIYTASHPLNVALRTSWMGTGKPVTIGDNCWIGGDAVILPGVTLGNNVVVGAGSVVTKSFGDNVVVAGNPARIIHQLDADGNVIG